MKPTASKLVRQQVDYTIHEGKLYFAVQEVKELYPNLKFPPDKIVKLPIGAVYRDSIRAEDIEEMTDFDKKVIQLMNFKK